MSANSERITFHVRLPNDLFWSFVEVAKSQGETRATIIRGLIRQYISKARKTPVIQKSH